MRANLAAVRRSLAIPRAHEWLLLAVLLILTDRYRWMMDDAFIYFRYADNLLFLGRGLVYNPGEYVEGYSSPFWLLLLLPFRALTLDYYFVVRALALLTAAAYGAALIWLNRELSPPDARDRAVVNFPLAASAAHYGLTTHFSSGLETPLVQLLAPLYASALLRPERRALQCAVALAPLVRAECALLGVLFLAFLLLRTRRFPAVFLTVAVAANGGWLLFRVIYYADFLPNTFYLKDVAQWWLGRAYLYNVSASHGWPWILILLAICALFGFRHLRREDLVPRAILLVTAASYAIYVARIGGDMLYHRYAALPVGLVLCACAGVPEAALLQLTAAKYQGLRAVALALLIATWFGVHYPPTLHAHPLFLPRDSRKWLSIADPNWHRTHRRLAYTDDRGAEDSALRARYAIARGSTPAPLKIRVIGFCADAYARFDSQIVHDYGLTDLVLARLPRPFGRPGHKLVQNEAVEVARLRLRARKANPLNLAWYDLPHRPRWVEKNRDALELLEQKLHNRHDFAENLRLSLRRVRLL